MPIYNPTNNEMIDTCLFGYGIRSGLKVQVKANCSVEVSTGVVVLASGEVVHIPQTIFRYYYTTSPNQEIMKSMLGTTSFHELVDENEDFDAETMDDLKQQHPDDIPREDFFADKIMGIVFRAEAGRYHFFLMSKAAAVNYHNIETATTNRKTRSLFSTNYSTTKVSNEEIESYANPLINLPKITLPRFGYHQLALISKAIGLKEGNIQNPFTQTDSYQKIFFEYKAIIDKYIYLIQDALDVLHRQFGSLLSHREEAYLKKYGVVLIKKWQRFCAEGEHLFYIQYFYDWLSDLICAYDELIMKIAKLKGVFTCEQTARKQSNILFLGPLLGGNTTYKTVAFRNDFQQVLDEKERKELRFSHWRLLMMIWTFDLPFLDLEKVLYSYGYDPGVEEDLNSIDYWQSVDKNEDERVDFEDLPIKATPTGFPNDALDKQAIPYYFPLDSNSIYSIHQFWNIEKTKRNQADGLLSYHAYAGDEGLPSMAIQNDSYTKHKEVLLPLAFHLKKYEYFRLEGFIGKVKANLLFDFLRVYNLNIEVIAVEVNQLEHLIGLDRRTSIQQAQTLVLVFTNKDEQIELQECKKDETPEVRKDIIVADFWLPYKYSCCGQVGNAELLFPKFS